MELEHSGAFIATDASITFNNGSSDLVSNNDPSINIGADGYAYFVAGSSDGAYADRISVLSEDEYLEKIGCIKKEKTLNKWGDLWN